MGVTLEIGGALLDLSTGQRIITELNSPFFDVEAGYQGQFSWPITVPLTKRNRTILGFVDILGRTEALQMHYDGTLQLSAMTLPVRMNIVNVTPGTVSLQVLLSGSRLASGLTSTSLKDIGLGSLNMLEFFGAGNVTANLPPVTFASYQAAMEQYMKRVSQASLGGPDYRGIVFGPVHNYYWNRSDVEGPEQAYSGSLNVWNAGAAPYGSEDNTGRYVLAKDAAGLTPTRIPHCGAAPQLLVSHVVRRMADYLGVEVKGDLFTDPDLRRQVLITAQAQEMRVTDFPSGGVSYLSALPENIIRLSRYVPDVSCAEFLRALHTTLFLAPCFDPMGQILELVSLDNVLKGTVLDWTDRAGPYVQQEADSFVGYKLLWTIGGADALLTDLVKDLKDATLTAPMTYSDWIYGIGAGNTVPKNAVTFLTDYGVYVWNPYNAPSGPLSGVLYALPLQDGTVTGQKEWTALGRGLLTMDANDPDSFSLRPCPSVDMDPTADFNEIIFANWLADVPEADATGLRPALAPKVSGWARVVGVGSEETGITYDWNHGPKSARERGRAWLEMLSRSKARKVTIDLKLTEADILSYRWYQRVQIGSDMFLVGKMSPIWPVTGFTRVELYYVG